MNINELTTTSVITPCANDAACKQVNVSFSNAITRAAQGLSLSEKRIIMLAVSKLDSMQSLPLPLMGTPAIRLEAKEYAGIYGLDINSAYEQLLQAVTGLFERQIRFYTSDNKNKDQPKQKLVEAIRWIGSYRYHEGQGWAELSFWHVVVPYLLDLSNQFTTYKLQHASNLKSIYAWRLMEMLSQFKKSRWIEISIGEFCHAMDATDKMSSDFAYIRRRMIEPAIAELEKENGWIIKWTPKLQGRKTIGLRFEYLFPNENIKMK